MSSITTCSSRARPRPRFLDDTPELFQFTPRRDRATKLLTYLGDVIVNGNKEVAGKPKPANLQSAPHSRARSRCSAARHQAAAGRAGPGEVRRSGPANRRAAAHRHHVPRRAPVAVCDAHAHLRHAGDRELRRAPRCTICTASRCGAARPSTSRCASCTKTRGSGCGRCARRSRISAFRCCCARRTRSAIPPIPTTSCRSSSTRRRRRASTSSASSIR